MWFYFPGAFFFFLSCSISIQVIYLRYTTLTHRKLTPHPATEYYAPLGFSIQFFMESRYFTFWLVSNLADLDPELFLVLVRLLLILEPCGVRDRKFLGSLYTDCRFGATLRAANYGSFMPTQKQRKNTCGG